MVKVTARDLILFQNISVISGFYLFRKVFERKSDALLTYDFITKPKHSNKYAQSFEF